MAPRPSSRVTASAATCAQTQLIEVDLAAILRGDESADLLLQPFDFLNVKEVPEWSEQEQVTLRRRSAFPGHLSDPARRDACVRCSIAPAA